MKFYAKPMPTWNRQCDDIFKDKKGIETAALKMQQEVTKIAVYLYSVIGLSMLVVALFGRCKLADVEEGETFNMSKHFVSVLIGICIFLTGAILMKQITKTDIKLVSSNV